jgi:hypothetical protein
MKKTIWKFPVPLAEKQSITVSKHAKFLCAKAQHGILTLWALVDNDELNKENVNIRIVGTGEPIVFEYNYLDSATYLDTVLMPDGLVWHVFTGG